MNTCNKHNKCIEKAIKMVEKISKKKGLHFTPLRRSIFTLIWQNHLPLKAYDILTLFQKEDPSAKPITIYRTLDFLLENGMIHKLESQNTYLGCNHPEEIHNCYFTICKKCKKVSEECQSNLLSNVYSNLIQQNFHVDHVTLEIQGICQNCQ